MLSHRPCLESVHRGTQDTQNHDVSKKMSQGECQQSTSFTQAQPTDCHSWYAKTRHQPFSADAPWRSQGRHETRHISICCLDWHLLRTAHSAPTEPFHAHSTRMPFCRRSCLSSPETSMALVSSPPPIHAPATNTRGTVCAPVRVNMYCWMAQRSGRPLICVCGTGASNMSVCGVVWCDVVGHPVLSHDCHLAKACH